MSTSTPSTSTTTATTNPIMTSTSTQPPASASISSSTGSAQPSTRKCRFFTSTAGCQNGAECRFSHEIVPQKEKKPQKPRAPRKEAVLALDSDGATQVEQPPIQPKKKLQRGQRKPKPAAKAKSKENEAPVVEKPEPPLQEPVAPTAQTTQAPARPSTPLALNPARAPVQRPTAKVPENLTPLELELRSIERRFRTSYKLVAATPLFFAPTPAPGSSSTATTSQNPTPQQSLPPTIIEFNLPPSDPDFPFDLEHLSLRLIIPTTIPTTDPNTSKPTPQHISTVLTGTRIKVLNPEIPADLARAVETGFRKRIDSHLINSANVTGRGALVPGQVLLGMMNWLDRELEKLLSGLGDSDVVGVTGLVVNNSRTAEEVRASVLERVNVGFRNVELLVPRQSDKEGGRVFYYGVPVDEENEGSDSDETGSEFNEVDTESLASSKVLQNGDSENEDEADETAQVENLENSVTPAHRGTQIRLVDPSLRAISLLECTSPKFLLSCTRCKSNMDSPTLLPNVVNTRACPTCSTALSITFRPSLVHMSSQTAGYLDLDGYNVLDMLPSAWQVTCEACQKVTSGVGVLKSLPRGEVEFRVGCTSCHSKMGIRIGDVKFVKLMPSVVTAAATASKMALKPKKRRNVDEGIVLGEPLPDNGACKHYRRSYRWFRFPCCGRAHACDICHEENKGDGHEMAWANRMICGFCSREQVYSQQAQCLCGKELTRKSGGGGGFWEGGAGTRNKTLMSRKDPRKMKGLNKTVSMKSSRVGKKTE